MLLLTDYLLLQAEADKMVPLANTWWQAETVAALPELTDWAHHLQLPVELAPHKLQVERAVLLGAVAETWAKPVRSGRGVTELRVLIVKLMEEVVVAVFMVVVVVVVMAVAMAPTEEALAEAVQVLCLPEELAQEVTIQETDR